MFRNRSRLALAIATGALALGVLVPASPASANVRVRRVALVYGDVINTTDWVSFLNSKGITVDLVQAASADSFNFSSDKTILIADDTGYLNTWAGDAADVAKIDASTKPVVGIGEGGYAFFGQLGLNIGWPHGWHGAAHSITPQAASQPIWPAPNAVTPTDPFDLYPADVNTVGIQISAQASSPGFTVMGLELNPALDDHADIAGQGVIGHSATGLPNGGRWRVLWGGSASPSSMTTNGQLLFINLLGQKPKVTLSPHSGPAGTTSLGVTSVGFAGNEPLQVKFDSTVVLTTTATDLAGAHASVSFVVPPGTPAGRHTVKVKGTLSGLNTTATFTVT